MNSSSDEKQAFTIHFGITSEEAMFFRLSSAVEAVVSYIIIFNLFPNIYSKKTRSSFYLRLCITYALILLIIFIRFYDFLESNIFRTMRKGHKIRFLLYGLATIEAMFDLSLVALGLEILIEVCSTVLPEKRKWILFSLVAAGIPVAFLFIILIIWESKKQFNGVLGIALTESIIPAAATIVITIGIYIFARRKKMALSEDSLLRIKIIILINLAAIVGMFLNLLLYTLNAEVVMDDLIDAIIKLGVVAAYIFVQPHHIAAPYMLPCLDVEATQMETSTQPIVTMSQNTLNGFQSTGGNPRNALTENGHSMRMVC